MKSTSFFLEIIAYRAAELLTERKREFLVLLQQAREDGKHVVTVRNKYNFKSNLHVQCNNSNTAPTNIGCGCEYCLARHNYSKAKLELHRKTKSFDRFADRNYYNDDQFSLELQKFNQEKKEALDRIKTLREYMLSVKEALISIDMPTI